MKKHKLLQSKHSGILLPLFSMNSKSDFGCGDIGSMSQWLDIAEEMGMDILEILPINEMPPGTNCPYTSMTAFAIDPIYISIKDIENLSPEIKDYMESAQFKSLISELRKKDYIDYDAIKKIKFDILWRQYLYFKRESDLGRISKKSFDDYKWYNGYWLNDYALFRRMKDVFGWISWTHWEEKYKNRDKNALEKFEKDNQDQVEYFKYIQWEIDKQWKKLSDKAKRKGIKFFGDLPFMVNQESADVWSRPYDFRLDLEAGAPPDAFSADGQKWGLPAYNWPKVQENDFEWWRLKVKKFAEFYDIFRIDHMVGFFRTWVIPKDPSLKPDFDLKDEYLQEKRGKDFLKAVIKASDMLPIAEDLGVIPDYVYKTLKELNVCGYKVMRWEKNKDGSYKSPEEFDEISFATTSTHDNEPMSLWWEITPSKEKKLFWEMVCEGAKEPLPHSYKSARDRVLTKAFKANSCFAVFPLQDIIASKERVNEPNTVGNHNWSYRIKEDAESFSKKNAELIKFVRHLSERRK
ncbi:MAG: 4-alpha-glucanotransferase [Elusimicrobia bacterium]|nr:4-alpha-glucanotransferase [Elusimicrobiota bacterium]